MAKGPSYICSWIMASTSPIEQRGGKSWGLTVSFSLHSLRTFLCGFSALAALGFFKTFTALGQSKWLHSSLELQNGSVLVIKAYTSLSFLS